MRYIDQVKSRTIKKSVTKTIRAWDFVFDEMEKMKELEKIGHFSEFFGACVIGKSNGTLVNLENFEGVFTNEYELKEVVTELLTLHLEKKIIRIDDVEKIRDIFLSSDKIKVEMVSDIHKEMLEIKDKEIKLLKAEVEMLHKKIQMIDRNKELSADLYIEESEESVKEVTEESVKEVTEESVKEVTEESVKEVIEEPVKEVIEEPVNKNLDEEHNTSTIVGTEKVSLSNIKNRRKRRT